MSMKTGILVDRVTGNGTTRTFELMYKLVDAPFIRMGDEYINVGVKGVSNEYRWYYTPKDNCVTQHENDEPLGKGQFIDVIYFGEFEVDEVT